MELFWSLNIDDFDHLDDNWKDLVENLGLIRKR